MPVLYAVLVLWCAVQIAVDRLTLLRYCATPPRYTGKLAALLLHSVPVAVLLHFCGAVYVFGGAVYSLTSTTFKPQLVSVS